MAAQELNYIGINRALSDFASASACEELINLRPTSEGLVPVKPFRVKMGNVTFKKIFEHPVGDKTNYIVLKEENGVIRACLVDDSGNEIQDSTMFQVSTSYYNNLKIDDIHFAYTGYIVLFSITDAADPYYDNFAFRWAEGKYNRIQSQVPNITYDITTDRIVNQEFTIEEQITAINENTVQIIKRGIETAVNSCQENNKNACVGSFIVAVAFKTIYGETFWTNQWKIHNPDEYIESHIPLYSHRNAVKYIYLNTDTGAIPDKIRSDGFFPSHDRAYIAYCDQKVKIVGVELSMNVSFPGRASFDKDSSLIKSVEIYTSRPKYHVDTNELNNNSLWFLGSFMLGYMPHLGDSELGFENQLLYLQKSIQIDELLNVDNFNFKLEFGGNLLTTNKTLPVDAGQVTRYGRILAYNSRFHFFDSVSRTTVEKPYFSFRRSGASLSSNHVFVSYDDGTNKRVLYLGTEALPDSGADYVIAQSLNIDEVVTLRLEGQTRHIKRYAMTRSQTYNCSVCTAGAVASDGTTPYEYEDLIGNETRFVTADEPCAINVSGQYNPFVFDVNHSYLAPGKVLDVKPQMVAVADVSYGDYPLNVFTNRGTYALLQGNGTVLYGSFRPVSNLVIGNGTAIPTEAGTFFIAAGGLWLVRGSTAVLVSDALSEGPHKQIRTCAGYMALCYNSHEQGAPDTGYQIYGMDSQVRFEKYMEGASLAYNRFRDELLVGNPDYNYTYVLSIKYRQWFKIGMKISQDICGSNIVNVKTALGMNILDLSDEIEDTTETIHLQTRPFSFGYQYSHIHRTIAMIRSQLRQDNLLILALYGSDDLNQWILLAYADRTKIPGDDIPLKISQIRTNPAGRSWRYYTVTLGGYANTDSDLGPVIVDYQTVIRRIG